MSVLCANDKGWVISHYDFSKNLYRNVHSASGKVDLTYNEKLFKISTPFLRDREAEKVSAFLLSNCPPRNVKKRKFINSCNDEVLLVQSAFNSLLEEAKNHSLFQLTVTPENIKENNATARGFVNEFFDFQMDAQIKNKSVGSFEGVSNVPYCKIIDINDSSYVMPPYSKFMCCDINDFVLNQTKKFDFILLDPPWWNKHVRRKKQRCPSKGYKMMSDSEIMNIPLRKYLDDLGLVGIWCTNASSHIEAVKHVFFPRWELDYVATWLWIKVTEGGEPVCPFQNSNGKKPYERIIFGAPNKRPSNKNPEELKCFLSTPSAIHSHKPPINEILKCYLPENPKCLELFSRYLLPGWTSVGNEVLLLQSLSLFKSVDVG